MSPGFFTALNPPPNVTRDEYRSIYQGWRKSGTALPLDRAIASAFGLTAAAVLANVVNRAQIAAESGGWTMVTPRYNMDPLRLTSLEEAEAVATLSRAGVLTIRNNEQGRRLLHVNLGALP